MRNSKLHKQVNNLYFNQKKTTSEIAKILDIGYTSVLNKIDRNLISGNRSKSLRNNKQEVQIVQNEVLDYFDIPETMLYLKSRIPEVVFPRQIAHHLAYNLTNSSNAFLGSLMGGYDHSTINNSRSSIDDYLLTDNDIVEIYKNIEKTCKTKLIKFRNG